MKTSNIEMRLTDEPFRKIKSGVKTVEVRLFDEKRRAVKTGDRIVFSRMNEPCDTIVTVVTALHKFDTFYGLYSSEIGRKCGIDGMSVEQAVADIYRYYTPDSEKKYGVLGIELTVIE